jgi:uncharacterized protein (TIGR03000 family)
VSIVNYYAPPAPAPAPAASVEVRLPADAELWFDGTPMAQRGASRAFTTPSLVPGVMYTYGLSARWRQQGRDVMRGERVTIRAGESIVVDFGPRDAGPGHMAVRETPRNATAVPVAFTAGHGALTEIIRGQVPARPLPPHMEVIDFHGQPARTTPAAPARMSTVQFEEGRR